MRKHNKPTKGRCFGRLCCTGARKTGALVLLAAVLLLSCACGNQTPTAADAAGSLPTGTQEARQTSAPEPVTAAWETALPETPTAAASRYCRSQLSASEMQQYDTLCTTIQAQEETLTIADADAEQLFRLCTLLQYDQPEYFWFDGAVSSVTTTRGSASSVELRFTYTMDKASRQQTAERIGAIVQPLRAQFGGCTDYEKVKGIYEFVINNTVYDASVTDQTICSVLLNGRGVCAGYARTMQYLLTQLGIQTLYVSGHANGQSHAWNIARIDGAFYMLDATWGDMVMQDGSQTLSYDYLCFTSAEGQRLYTIDAEYLVPVCTQTEYNYYNQEQRLLPAYSASGVYAILARDYAAGTPCVIKFADQDSYSDAVTALFTGEQDMWQLAEQLGEEYGAQIGSYSYGKNDTLYCIEIVLND